EYELIEMAGILIDNAVEALKNIHEGTKDCNMIKKIYIFMKEIEEHVEVIVANTSNYYEDDMTERFFEAGYSSKGKGRGIGLSKLKRMVHERKGEIMVSNELIDGINYLAFTVKIQKGDRKKP
ncbi:MAG: GHKL domain-containing protein, partial [Lachnospiraceae bacterium]|nr:GHKL domain-containing protein [Lachnospiraceae bacterium]